MIQSWKGRKKKKSIRSFGKDRKIFTSNEAKIFKSLFKSLFVSMDFIINISRSGPVDILSIDSIDKIRTTSYEMAS